MRKLDVPCRGSQSEEAFWNAYLEAAQPEGARVFGRNLDAFWDAFWDALNGGPGWPGECEVRLQDSAALSNLRKGVFLEKLAQISRDSKFVRLVLD